MKSQLTDRQFARIGWVLVWDALANSKVVFARPHSIQLHRAFGFFGNEFDNQRSQPPKRAKGRSLLIAKHTVSDQVKRPMTA